MRDSLTALAIGAILLLSAALVGPHLVDWTRARGLIEEQIAQASGLRAKINGRVDLELFPTPYFRVEDIALEGDDARLSAGGDGAPTLRRASAEAARFELALAPLLRGEIEFVEARLERPTLVLRLPFEGAARGAKTPPAPSSTPPLRFSALRISDGALIVEDASGRSVEAAGLDLKAEAQSLRGPFKGEGSARFGSAGADGARISFRLASGVFDAGALPLRILAQTPRGALTFDGEAKFSPELGLTGALSLEDGGAKAAARLELTPQKAAFSSLEASWGEAPRALVAKGEAEIAFTGARPEATLALRAGQLDLDRFRAAAPQGLSFDFTPPLPLTLRLSAGNALFGGAEFSDVEADLVFPFADARSQLRLFARGPHGSRLSLDGAARWAAAPDFDGRIVTSADDTSWLRAFAAALGLKPPFDDLGRNFALSADVKLSRRGASASGLDLTLDGTRFAGSLEASFAASGEPPRVDAALVAQRLDVLGPFVARAFGAGRGAPDGRLSLSANNIVAGASPPLGALKLSASKAGGGVALDDLAFNGRDGDFARAKGRFDGGAARIDAEIRLPKAGPLTQALSRLPADEGQRRALSRLASLTPVDLVLAFEAEGEGDAFTLKSLKAQGSLGDAVVSAKAEGDLARGEANVVSIVADSRASLPFLRLAGLAAPGAPDPGRAHLEFAARAEPEAGKRRARLDAALGEARLSFEGEIGGGLVAPKADGALSFAAPDAAPTLRALGLVFPDYSQKPPASFSASLSFAQGTMRLDGLRGSFGAASFSGGLALRGAEWSGGLQFERLEAGALAALALGPPEPARAGELWPSLAFAEPLFDPPRARLAVEAAELAMTAPLGPMRKARMTLATRPGLLAIEDFSAELQGGGAARGALSLARAEGEAALSGEIDVSGASFDTPSARGRLDLALGFSGAGRSAQDLVGALSGSGKAQVSRLVIPRADPGALARVVKAYGHEDRDLSMNAVAVALGGELARADFSAGTQTFGVSLRSGALAFAAPPDAADPAFSGSYDLRRGVFAQRVLFSAAAGPDDGRGERPQAALVAQGPLAGPQTVKVDAAALANLLAVRALDRESGRIDNFEADLRERSFFRRRLESERRRDAERARAAAEKASREAPTATQ